MPSALYYNGIRNGENMSNLMNEIAKDRILDDVLAMNTGSILRELDGGVMTTGLCDSFDERVALTDRDFVVDKLVEKRFLELPDCPW